MDWNKTKTLTIIFLLLLDCFLGFLIYLERGKYNMDTAQINTITELLKNNEIYLNTSVPRSYRPMQQLSMSGYEYDEPELLTMFFGKTSGIERLPEIEDRIIYVSGDQTLTLQNGFITFDCPSGTNDMELTLENALMEARAFMPGMGEISSFVQDTVYIVDEGFRILFCQKYKNNIIYTNYIEFLITEKGIVQIYCKYSRPKGFSGQLTELCAVDEALLNFMQLYKDAFDNKPADVRKIDLVFYQKEGSIIDSDSLTAIPHYRIMVYGFESPFLINAYLNRIET